MPILTYFTYVPRTFSVSILFLLLYLSAVGAIKTSKSH